MRKPERDILTTAQTAKILGVSIRTAQLLIEGGSVPSWKTPGGHRRVYRADVEALIEGRGDALAQSSATVVVIASGDRLEAYGRMLEKVPECTAELFEDIATALLAIGSLPPHAVIIDLADADKARLRLVRSLAENPSLRQTRILAVDAPEGKLKESNRVILLKSADAAVASLRMSLADRGDMAQPSTDQTFPLALNERQRLVALERTGLVDTGPEEPFDRLTWLAATTLDAPIALLTLLTPTRHWFKSRFGYDLPEAPRSSAFCNYTIMQRGVFTVEDMSADPRFATNPGVVGSRGLRFYAGAPVLDPEGFALGSLCIMDYKVRSLSEHQSRVLRALAGVASDEIRLRMADRRLREALRREERQKLRASPSEAPPA